MAVINVKSQTNLSGFYIVFKGSIKNEKKGWFGLSHLMEHLICHHFDDMMDDFDRDGINWNAYTSNNEIVFYFTGLDEYLSKYRDKILEKLLTFSISEEQLKIERKIVLEEYKDYFNAQSQNHHANLYRKLYNLYGAIGLKEDLQNINYQDIKDYFQLQFSKPHDIINVSKNSEFVTNIEFSTKTFDKKVVAGNYSTEIEPYNGRNGKSSIIYNSQVLHEDFSYVSFICYMLGKGLKSPLYQEIREKRGLVYYVHCYIDDLTYNSGVVNILTETSDENVDKVEKVTEYVLGNPDKFMTQDRFDIIKQYFEIKFKKNEIDRYISVSKYIEPIEWQIEPILKDLTLEKIMSIYNKYFDFSKFVKSVDTRDFIK